jgi:hypothetical protein
MEAKEEDEGTRACKLRLVQQCRLRVWARGRTVECIRYLVIKVEANDPEVFLIAWLDRQRTNGSVVKTSENFSETEVRAGLKNARASTNGNRFADSAGERKSLVVPALTAIGCVARVSCASTNQFPPRARRSVALLATWLCPGRAVELIRRPQCGTLRLHNRGAERVLAVFYRKSF